MGSSTVRAQELANEANIQMTRETNQSNQAIQDSANASQQYIADRANDFNYRMFNEQNQWNLQQWERENEYNSPSEQMRRYIDAGINPIFATGNITPGNAQQLTSASASPAEVAQLGVTPNQAPHVSPEYDPFVGARIQGILGAANSIVNGAQGFMKLGLEDRDVSTRERDQASREGLNRAESYYKRSLAVGQDVRNAFDVKTFDTRVSASIQELDNMQANYDKLVAEGKNAVELGENIKASRNLIQKEIENYQSQIDYRVNQLKLQARMVAVDERNASVNEAAYQLNSKQFDLDVKRYNRESAKLSNDELFRWSNAFAYTNKASGELSGNLGPVRAGGEVSTVERRPVSNLAQLMGYQLQTYERFQENPTQENKDLYERFSDLVDEELSKRAVLPKDDFAIPQNAQGFGIINPY